MVTQARALRTPITRKAFCFSLSMMVIYRLGNCLPSRLSGFHILRQLYTHIGSNDDPGGGKNSDARCSSHTTDTVGKNHKGKTHKKPDNQPPYDSNFSRILRPTAQRV